jgi:hypothetical protein
MTPEQERFNDAKTRVKGLEHAVTEAETAVRTAPSDHEALGKLDMAVKVLRAGRKAFADAEAELTQSGQTQGARTT